MPTLRSTLAIASYALIAGCAAPVPTARPLTVDSAAVIQAVHTYRLCAVAAMLPLESTSRPDSALQVASIAEGQCARELDAVRAAVEQENASNAYGAVFAQGFIEATQKRTVQQLAAGMLKRR